VTPVAWGVFALAGALALVDWFAVGRGIRALEYAAKPATLAALIVAAVALDPQVPGRRAWFVAALVLSLAGDVFLMLPERRRGPDLFVAGLASFLLAHVAYVAGFSVEGPSAGAVAGSALVVGVLAVVLGARIVRAAAASDGPAGAAPVAVYVGVISTMVAFALATRESLAALGAVSFFLSDFLIGWTRFVGAVRGGRLAVITTYHVGQALLVLSLV